MTASSLSREISPATGESRLPGAWRTGLARGRLEVVAFFRERQTVVFVFALPAVLLVLLGSIFGHQKLTDGITVGQLFTAGIVGSHAA